MIILKIAYEGELRRLKVENSAGYTLDDFCQSVSIFGISSSSGSELTIRYTDDEGDVIDVGSTEELQEGFRIAEDAYRGVLRMEISTQRQISQDGIFVLAEKELETPPTSPRPSQAADPEHLLEKKRAFDAAALTQAEQKLQRLEQELKSHNLQTDGMLQAHKLRFQECQSRMDELARKFEDMKMTRVQEQEVEQQQVVDMENAKVILQTKVQAATTEHERLQQMTNAQAPAKIAPMQPFATGEMALYTHTTGEQEACHIVQIHYDVDSGGVLGEDGSAKKPYYYYTVKMRDGREKQTLSSRLEHPKEPTSRTLCKTAEEIRKTRNTAHDDPATGIVGDLDSVGSSPTSTGWHEASEQETQKMQETPLLSSILADIDELHRTRCEVLEDFERQELAEASTSASASASASASSASASASASSASASASAVDVQGRSNDADHEECLQLPQTAQPAEQQAVCNDIQNDFQEEEEVRPFEWHVPSFTNPDDAEYLIRNISPGEFTCSCPDWTKRRCMATTVAGRRCKHIRHVIASVSRDELISLEEDNGEVAARPPAPTPAPTPAPASALPESALPEAAVADIEANIEAKTATSKTDDQVAVHQWAAELTSLADMGFFEHDRLCHLLEQEGGDVGRVVGRLLA